MVEVQILIPDRSNEGERFTREQHEAFEAMLNTLFGGHSRLPGLVNGSWKSDTGATYHDELYLYVVFVSAVFADSAKVLETVTFAKAHYGQEAIAIRYLGMSEIL